MFEKEYKKAFTNIWPWVGDLRETTRRETTAGPRWAFRFDSGIAYCTTRQSQQPQKMQKILARALKYEGDPGASGISTAEYIRALNLALSPLRPENWPWVGGTWD